MIERYAQDIASLTVELLLVLSKFLLVDVLIVYDGARIVL
jgi:hypothetical protein